MSALYTSTVVTPRRRSRVWASLAQSTAFAIGLPLVILVGWGLWSTVSASPYFPSPLVIADAFVDTWRAVASDPDRTR